jgi:hypothetical protein
MQESNIKMENCKSKFKNELKKEQKQITRIARIYFKYLFLYR